MVNMDNEVIGICGIPEIFGIDWDFFGIDWDFKQMLQKVINVTTVNQQGSTGLYSHIFEYKNILL